MEKQETEKPISLEVDSPGTLPAYIKMYEISGQETISEHGFARYKKDKKQDEAIIQLRDSVPDLASGDFFRQKIKSAPQSEQLLLIQQGLKHPSKEVQSASLNGMEDVPEEKRAFFVELGLGSPHVEVQELAARLVGKLPAHERDPLFGVVVGNIQQGLISPDVETQKIAAHMTIYVPTDQMAALIKLGLDNPNMSVQKISASIISLSHLSSFEPAETINALRDTITQKIQKGFETQNIEDQVCATTMIPYAPAQEQVPFIELGLHSPHIEIQKSSIKMLWCIPEESRISLIKSGLDHPNIDIQLGYVMALQYFCAREAVEPLRTIVAQKIKQRLQNPDIEIQKKAFLMVWAAPDGERASIIEQGLNSPYSEVQVEAAQQVFNISQSEQYFFRNVIAERIKQGLRSEHIEEQKACAAMVEYVFDEEEIFLLIKLGLDSPYKEVQEIFVDMIRNVGDEYRGKLLDAIIEKGLGSMLVEPPLYKKQSIPKERFSRQKFKKTGSETTLLGGRLKGKTIIRRIVPEAFLTWQRLYEDYQLWQDAGFDYVPIEPINSYRLNKNGMVDVFCGVLDLSLGAWESRASLFMGELDEERKKITEVLYKAHIEHGHTHDDNFCLRFFRNADGSIDFTRVPRLYLIDFDMAVSPETH
jgi:hypothetical protein